jgi:beta-glucosidase-like glycosyl hydrolase
MSNTVLRKEWGFDGVIESDWYAIVLLVSMWLFIHTALHIVGANT